MGIDHEAQKFPSKLVTAASSDAKAISSRFQNELRYLGKA
jgi:hypothetical protein